MARVTRSDFVQALPSNVPVLTEAEAVRAARKLYRFFKSKTWTGPVRVTSGNRHSWFYRGVMVVNPDAGWQRFLSDWGWYHFRTGSHKRRTTGWAYALKATNEATKRGWFTGALQVEEEPEVQPPTPDEQLDHRLAVIDKSLKRWETKRKRANTAIKKLVRRQKALIRAAEKRKALAARRALGGPIRKLLL
jgi:hypothetical protein